MSITLNLTTVLTPTLPAAVAGFVGYYGAKKQAETAAKQADAPVAQIGMQEAIADRREREKAYLMLTNSIDWLLNGRGRVGDDGRQTARWRLEFDGHVNRVKILGAYEVPAAASNCAEIVHVVIKPTGSDGLMFTDSAAFDENVTALTEARDALIQAMRTDVAPRKDQPALANSPQAGSFI